MNIDTFPFPANEAEAICVTDFWNFLGNSLLITGVTIVLSLIIHSMAGYVVGRSKEKHKGFKMIYFYIVSSMFVYFAILMMPLVKETVIMKIDNMFGVILLYAHVLFYMPMNIMLYRML